MIDHPSEKLVAAAQYLKHACLLTLAIWCHKKKDTLTSASFHKILYLISRSIKNINFRWIVVHTKARCSCMMRFCLNDHQLVPNTVPYHFQVKCFMRITAIIVLLHRKSFSVSVTSSVKMYSLSRCWFFAAVSTLPTTLAGIQPTNQPQFHQ